MNSIHRDITGSLLGPKVLLVQVHKDGTRSTKSLPVSLAKLELLSSTKNGTEIKRAWIEFRGLYDDW